jgi:hypothetical protein
MNANISGLPRWRKIVTGSLRLAGSYVRSHRNKAPEAMTAELKIIGEQSAPGDGRTPPARRAPVVAAWPRS